jgi:hypothetical protein
LKYVPYPSKLRRLYVLYAPLDFYKRFPRHIDILQLELTHQFRLADLLFKPYRSYIPPYLDIILFDFLTSHISALQT